jgi:hypothetical protein
LRVHGECPWCLQVSGLVPFRQGVSHVVQRGKSCEQACFVNRCKSFSGIVGLNGPDKRARWPQVPPFRAGYTRGPMGKGGQRDPSTWSSSTRYLGCCLLASLLTRLGSMFNCTWIRSCLHRGWAWNRTLGSMRATRLIRESARHGEHSTRRK